jgi:DNA-binding protein
LVDQDPYWTRRIFMGDVTIKEVSVKNEQVLVHEKKESKKQKVEVRNDD